MSYGFCLLKPSSFAIVAFGSPSATIFTARFRSAWEMVADIQVWKDNHKVEVVEKDVVERLNAALKRAGVKPA